MMAMGIGRFALTPQMPHLLSEGQIDLTGAGLSRRPTTWAISSARWIRYSLAAITMCAEEGSITRAAERLHRVPSNLSTRLKQMEEQLVVSEARTCWPDVMPNDTAKLAECEFWIISEMSSFLIVHHPYRVLKELGPVLQLTSEETSTSWQVVNDSCVSDLPLIYPPHVIALTAIFLAVVLKPSMAHQGIHAATAAACATVKEQNLGPVAVFGVM